MKNKKLSKESFDKRCTNDGAGRMRQWLDDRVNNEEASEMLWQMWEESNAEVPAIRADFEGMLANIRKRAGLGRPATEGINDSHAKAISVGLSGADGKQCPRPFSVYSIAAGLISILVICALVYRLSFQDKYFIYSTAYGETKVVTLPDGSDVTLNANSTIKYAYNFNGESNDAPRRVFLDGEGFFNVRKKVRSNASKVKFIVQANHVVVEVLGTSFNVNTRRGKTVIALNCGSVRLGIEQSGRRMKEMTMRAGDLVEVGNTGKEFVKRTVDVESYSSWRHNKLIFSNTRVGDILNLIEDNFGYKVVLHDKKLENRLYTDTTPADNVDLLLSKLSIVYDLKLARTDKQVIIQAK